MNARLCTEEAKKINVVRLPKHALFNRRKSGNTMQLQSIYNEFLRLSL